jgi:hypothetical protein
MDRSIKYFDKSSVATKLTPTIWILIFQYIGTKELYSNTILVCKFFAEVLNKNINAILSDRNNDIMVYELSKAIKCCNFTMIVELSAKIDKKPANICDIAAKYNMLSILDVLIKNSFQCKKTVSIIAVNKVNLDMVKYLCENNLPISKMAMRRAIEINSQEMCIYFGRKNIGSKSEHCKGIMELNFKRSYEYRHFITTVDIKKIESKIGMCAYAALKGRTKILKYLNYYGYRWSSTAYVMAILGGHLDIIELLYNRSCPLNATVLVFAAYYGNLDIIKYLHDIKCPHNELVCAYASFGGHIDIINYLRNNGYPWNHKSCKLATIGGHLGVLKYLHSNSCFWDDRKVHFQALKRGHTEILEYLREKI